MISLTRPEFPLAARYDADWVRRNEMGPNALWLTEALLQVMDIQPGMRILDLGCGKAMSSIFLARERHVEVWATDFWIDAGENLERIQEAGVSDRVFPINAEARALPFAEGFFDAVVSLDSYHYFGTDVHYLEFYLLKLIRAGGQLGIVSPAARVALPQPPPPHLGPDWYWLNTVDWWRQHWQRNPALRVEIAELLPHGWELWRFWNDFLFSGEPLSPHNSAAERKQIEDDRGRYLGFLRMTARRR